MPKPRHEPPIEKTATKRRSVEQGLKLADAAHEAVWRLYCDVFALWRGCAVKKCIRQRRCRGNAAGCLMRGLPAVPPARLSAAAAEVAAGGPRREPPASHLEWIVRREPLPLLTRWRRTG